MLRNREANGVPQEGVSAVGPGTSHNEKMAKIS